LLLSFASCSSSKQEKNIIKAPTTPETEMLQTAMKSYDQQLYRVSMQNWVDLRDGYPNSYFATLAELKIADAQFYAGDFPAALVSYEEFTKLHPGHEAMPYVRYQIGNCHLAQYRDVTHDQGPLQSAIKSFQSLIAQHPRSEYVVLARRRMRKARELQAEYERYVAGFYEKRGLHTASSSRLKYLASNFPETQAFALAKPVESGERSGSSGKIPDRPEVLPSLDSNIYVSRLNQIRSQMAGSVSEENLVESAQPALPKPTAEKSVTTNPILSVECEEQEQGAMFIALLDREVRPDANGRFKLKLEGEVNSEPQSCTAGGQTVTFRQSGDEILLESSGGEFQTMVLTRPDRIVALGR
jgi:outer membrane protein assembly factor BamD